MASAVEEIPFVHCFVVEEGTASRLAVPAFGGPCPVACGIDALVVRVDEAREAMHGTGTR